MSWRRTFVFTLPLVLSTLACDSSSPTSPAIRLPATLQLQAGESVLVSSGNLVVSFFGVVQDSRCPTSPDIQCVWEGEAVVSLGLSESGSVLGSPLLSTHPHRGSSPNVVRLGSYSLQVIELGPTRVTTDAIPQADYRLRLRIERN